jgi:hypothetical protein
MTALMARTDGLKVLLDRIRDMGAFQVSHWHEPLYLFMVVCPTRSGRVRSRRGAAGARGA